MGRLVDTDVSSTLDTTTAASRSWDVVVIGAGPAGSLAAVLLARQGLSTLLVERKCFPRYKVCGACLNPLSLSLLRAAGLEHSYQPGVPLDRFHLQSRGRTLSLHLPGSCSISREQFDARLVIAAVDAGAAFLSECSARIAAPPGGTRSSVIPPALRDVELKPTDGTPHVTHASVVVAADGLAHGCLSGLEDFSTTVVPTSRVGAGAVVTDAPSFYEPGCIYMSVARGGYVGLVRLEDGRLNAAAAMGADHVRNSGSLADAASSIIHSSGLPAVNALAAAEWHGTPALTRSTHPLAAHRVFVVGDAAGYVEPFTGEGIAWALASAQSVVPLVQRGVQQWKPLLQWTWHGDWAQAVGRHQVWCRRLARLLRYPITVSAVASVVSACPWLAGPIVSSLNRVSEQATSALRTPTAARNAG